MKQDLKKFVHFDWPIDNFWLYNFKFKGRDEEGKQYSYDLKNMGYY